MNVIPFPVVPQKRREKKDAWFVTKPHNFGFYILPGLNIRITTRLKEKLQADAVELGISLSELERRIFTCYVLRKHGVIRKDIPLKSLIAIASAEEWLQIIMPFYDETQLN